MEGYPHFRSSGIHFPTLLHQIAFFDTLFPTHCKNIIYAVFRQSIGKSGGGGVLAEEKHFPQSAAEV